VDEAEQIDALPVLAEDVTVLPAAEAQGSVERHTGAALIPAMQAAAAAAGGFVAGAAVVGLVHRRHRRAAALAGKRGRSLVRRGRPPRRGGAQPLELLQVVGSRSLLLDVHLLGGSGADR
jgi:hypothetical protein